MTPGQVALHEAARLETARIYSQTMTPTEEAAAKSTPDLNLTTAIAFWTREGQSPASIAFRLGINKRTVLEHLERLAARQDQRAEHPA
jgi:DNA-binding NarL/FixJ family response regulator